jgi:hypothetical protein
MASDRFGWHTIFRDVGSGVINAVRWVSGKEVSGGPLKDRQDQAKRDKRKNEKPERGYKVEEKTKSNRSPNPLEKDTPKPDSDPLDSEKYKAALEHLKSTNDRDFSKGVSDASRWKS